MQKEYKINKSSIWIYFYKILLTTLTMAVVGILVYSYFNNVKSGSIVLVMIFGVLLGWFLVFGFPLFLLYFNHLKYSNSAVLIRQNNIFEYHNSKNSITFSFEDIEKIELWLTPPAYDKRIDWQYFGKYHFTRVIIKTGDIINISCLVFDETSKVFPKQLIERKKKFFPLMQKNELILKD